MDKKRIAQTAAIALKIAKQFNKKAQWSKIKIYRPLKRHKIVNDSKLTAEFKHKVQRAIALRIKADRTRKSRDHANHTHAATIQREYGTQNQKHEAKATKIQHKAYENRFGAL